MTNEIVLESRFTIHQKIHIILSIGAPFIIIIFLLIVNMPLNFLGYLVLLGFMSLYTLLVCLALTKRGLLKVNDNLYRGLYFRKKLILKKKIDLTHKTKVSILKFKRSQKMAWFTVANPDLSTVFNSFDVTLLNDKHTIKDPLVSLNSNDLAEKSIEFLEQNFDLKFEIYSPDFS
ncbi:hypothetical protein HN014_00625 [Aquimarina sp. TRL1]|uniref:hypothetical protein n=1 Tax=Aquimarina sp. (strain TRL1) TaxID=2736252 RepID=UPI00158A1110|nr:hypothetical protein [Aquimarina sp. TRL1]QKX03481.1 hypothetical protein HN014_00625 [Aquimarina sp. TRL1]